MSPATPYNETVHLMRGVAAAIVASSHLILMSFGAMGLVQGFLGVAQTQPPISSPALFQLSLILGQFGVGLFFVISGYVIAAVLMRSGSTWRARAVFLLARYIRLWPTYAVCFLCGAIILWWLSHGEPAFGWADVFGHLALGFRDLLQTKNIDGIVWTLEIEIKFYIISALLMPRNSRKLALYIVLIACGAMFATHIVTQTAPSDAARADSLAQFLNVLILMQVGTLAWLHETKQVSKAAFIGVLVLLLLCFLMATRPGLWAVGTSVQVKVTYVLAATFFLATYRLGQRAGRFGNRPIQNWLGTISYPLYALHPILGYAIIHVLTAAQVPLWLAIGLASALVLVFAHLTSVWIERPTQHFSRSIRG